ncbi:hypothetical protein HDF24_05425 [Mucilaginibacter sp. X4EP1]|jgi:hypothetical protein|uniref:hypothetical protein n=1 Tax=Mucilaginibacter sp. X4EP1 TaxID=2723092 RepID=UPI00216A7F7B|nr:hypothetical protein [Mucilaginibacter sp. X4EP1]MCS3814467.1 hypothetical protein [Mucilaginibacter sp. X4EP1]
MKNSLIVTAVLSAASLFTQAQEIKHTAQPDSIIKIIPFGEGREEGYLYTIGGRLQTREDVEIRLMAYAPSAMEFKKTKTNITWFYVSAGGFAASSAVSIIDFANNSKHAVETTGFVNGEPTFTYQKRNSTGAYVFSTIATGFLISGIINLTQAVWHTKKALRAYNERFE